MGHRGTETHSGAEAHGGTGARAGGRAAFVIGHPVAHSRSPLIHGHWLAAHAIAGDYRARDVAPDALEAWLGGLDPAATPGGNVTVPHKEAVRAWLAERVDADAAAIGAVNTLWWQDGRLMGSNTDGFGLMADLDARAPGWRGAGHAVVIGAGGAARAVVHALAGAGLRVTVANRTPARAERLAEAFGLDAALPLAAAAPALREAGLVVNTASLGMAGAGDADGAGETPHLDPANLRADAIAYDIVYVPLETPFLTAARAAGARGVDGLGMLLHQAVPGFERWFGVRPEVDAALRARVEATL